MAADYYRAVAGVEERRALGQSPTAVALEYGQALALIDTLCTGTLNDTQRETMRVLRSVVAAMTELDVAPL